MYFCYHVNPVFLPLLAGTNHHFWSGMHNHVQVLTNHLWYCVYEHALAHARAQPCTFVQIFGKKQAHIISCRL
jgi:hypothetical protein